MSQWYVSRDRVKTVAASVDITLHPVIDDTIDGISREIDTIMRRQFIPVTEQRKFDDAPPHRRGSRLYLDRDLISITAFTDQGDDAVAVNSTEYRLMPNNEGPPYHWLELMGDVSGAEFKGDPDTRQDSFRITGLWGYGNDTVAAGNLNGALADTTGTALSVTDGSLIDVGDTLLVDSESLFVSDRADEDLGVNLSGTLTASYTNQTITFSGAPTDSVQVGEVIRINSEEMRVRSVTSTTVVHVVRSINGTALAAHSNTDDIFVERSYTIERGADGTTAATHSDNAAITKYRPPADIRDLALGMAIERLQQHQSGWGRTVQIRDDQALMRLRNRAIRRYRRNLFESV